MSNLKQHQPALSVKEQIENLISLGLEIENVDYAADILNDISYFRLVKAFGLGLKPKNKAFDGIKFEHIVNLYYFNCDLRQLLFPAIETIEVNLRCRIANFFSRKYGCFGYKDCNNFESAGYHLAFLNDINAEIKRNMRTPFVINFSKNYVGGEIPFYALIELFSFGLLSKFYKNMKREDKKEIAKSFGINYKYFESWVESISYVRNICAHYGRLYNMKLTKSPMLYSQHKTISNNRIFGIILCLKYILYKNKAWSTVHGGLIQLMPKYEEVDIRKMGFPENWQTILAEA